MLKDTPQWDLVQAQEYISECHTALKFNQLGVKESPKKSKQRSSSPSKIIPNQGVSSQQSKRVMLDCLMILALINFEWQEWD